MEKQFKYMLRVHQAIAEYAFYRNAYITSYSVCLERIKIEFNDGNLYTTALEFYSVDDIEREIELLKARSK